MDVLLLIASLTLAVVFAVAGVAKLLDRAGSRTAARAFGVPERLVGLVSVALPVAELAVAGLLLFPATRWSASIAALGLLLMFCAAIARALARGETPDCHCFGQVHSAPAGWSALARNAALGVVAAFIVVAARDDAGPGAFAWTTRLDSLEWLVLTLAVVLGAVVVLGGYAVTHVLRSYGRVLVRLDTVEARLRAAGFELEEPDDMPQLGLAPGTPAPMFWLPDIDGDRLALNDLLERGRPLLLVFTSPSCGSCTVLMPTVARWQREHADELTIALLNDGDLDLIRADASRYGLENVLVDEELAAYTAYEANGTPSAVLVAADGSVASWLAAGSEWIETLVEQALDGGSDDSGLPIGADLPERSVELLDGSQATLRELVDRPTVLLFWNPGCGYCRSMHDDLVAWEAAPPSDAPALMVIAAGAPEDVRAERFASQVVLDPDWTLAPELGANGTPMAVLVDAERRIASSFAAGGEQTFELLGARVRAAEVNGREPA